VRKSSKPAARKAANVLVVDDEAGLRELLADALTSEDLKVSTAGSGREAIDLAGRKRVDLLITDIRLGDCTGLEVIDEVRRLTGDVPAVVITGHRDVAALTEASRRRPIEVMTKPLDLDRLGRTVREELRRKQRDQRLQRQARRLRRFARSINLDRKSIRGKLQTTCVDLASAYRTLSGRMSLQQSVIGYQNVLIAARSDDDVFAALFRLFAMRSGPVSGVAMVCNENADLNVVGRFGVPQPDELAFCQKLASPIVERVLKEPRCLLLDAGQDAESFDPSIRRRLPGVTVLAVPLIPAPGELIGLAILYRKGEQPFTDADLALADIVAFPSAVAVRQND
jgi:DNA-binding response OmpR family regulator